MATRTPVYTTSNKYFYNIIVILDMTKPGFD